MGNVNWIREKIEKVERAAARGNAEAAYELAQRLMTGRNTERNPRRAYQECAFAASRGLVPALNMQGYLLAQGLGVEPDEDEAFRCFSRAALRGNPVAQYNLAVCFAEGISLDEPDLDSADKWLRRSADAGYAKARIARARRLFIEARDTREREIALTWLEKAGEEGDTEAMEVAYACRRALKQQAAGLPVSLPALALTAA